MSIHNTKPFEGEEFSQFEPLTVRISNILRQYPDGGQIFKEIIQNADDARAQHVKLVFDERQHRSDLLFSQSLKPFQGPALLAYNSAVFENKDFESIRSLGASRKSNDLTKTGRFGIGFNSVYHVTDLPSFVSGRHLVMLDPHARYLPGERQTCGRRWDFVETKELSKAFSDQFEPFKVFGNDMESHFQGTIFRFPLRTPELSPNSQISKIPYTFQSVENLMNSFKKEAPIILLFLKFVESIELYRWPEGATKPVKIFGVSLINLTDQLKLERRRMVDIVSQPNYLQNDNSQEYSFVVTVHLTEGESSEADVSDWLVCNKMATGNARKLALEGNIACSNQLIGTESALPQSQKLIPWGGVACKLESNKESMKLAPVQKGSGKLFCFLPIATETPLPVHVNGCFELSLNRRDLWKGDDLEGAGQRKAKWNMYLMDDAIAPCYAHMLCLLAESISPEDLLDFYHLWALHVSHLTEPWTSLAKSLFNRIFSDLSKKVLYSPSRGGSWVCAREAIFVPDHLPKEIVYTLLDFGIPVVEPPAGLREALSAVGTLQFVTPPLVRSVLKSHRAVKLERDVSIQLLQYCLSDAMYEDMCDVPLVPLLKKASGMFQKANSKHPHYIIGSSAEWQLLPTLQGRFVDISIPSHILQTLKSITNILNIKIMDNVLFAQLLSDILPPSWKEVKVVAWEPGVNPSHPSKQWLHNFWEYVKTNVADLSLLQGWPLLPTTDGKLHSLLSLEQTHGACIRGTIPTHIAHILTKVGGSVVNPEYSVDHVQITNFLFPATADGVLRCFHNASKQQQKSLETMFSILGAQDKQQLYQYFCKSEWYEGILFTDTQRKLLMQLPMYETHSPGLFISVEGYSLSGSSSCYFPPESLDTPLKAPNLIKRFSPQDNELLGFLGVKILTKSEYYRNFLFSSLDLLEEKERDQVIVQMLDNLPVLSKEDSSFLPALSALAFVPTVSGKLRPPSALFDPEQQSLLVLFSPSEHDSILPAPSYRDPGILLTLQKLGLQAHLSRAICVERIAALHSQQSSSSADPIFIRNTAKQLLAYIDQNLTRLLKDDSMPMAAFTKELLNHAWIPIMSMPDTSPPLMAELWYDSPSILSKPADTRPSKDAFLCSSVLPLCDVHLSPALLNELQWVVPLSVEIVLGQLLNVVAFHAKHGAAFQEGEDSQSLDSEVTSITQHIYAFLNDILSPKSASKHQNEIALIKKKLHNSPWIWIGTFVRANQVAFDANFDLAPFLFRVHRDVSKFSNLLDLFHVKREFDMEDLTTVLHKLMAVGGLKPQELNMAIAIIQQIANSIETGKVPRNKLRIPVPTSQGKLQFNDDIFYNNTPWVTDGVQEYPVVHPRISNATADLVGVRPLSHQIQLAAVENIDLDSFADLEPFGQHERLTTRISTILSDYPDGSSLLCELLQNADDAGATEVHIVYDKTSYNTQSLFSSKLEEFQGPAIMVYNDAIFKEADFAALCRLGVPSKFRQPTKIGKFGIGFNSVYHMTDVPAIVSDHYVVLLDPHAKYVPHTTLHNPGARFNFTKSNLSKKFPDQFEPFTRYFGCDFTKPFQGTLFRLPLRTVPVALASEIKKAPYTPENVGKLFSSFINLGAASLLFLKHLRKVTISERDYTDGLNESRVIYSIELRTSQEGAPSVPSKLDLKPVSTLLAVGKPNELIRRRCIGEEFHQALLDLQAPVPDEVLKELREIRDSQQGKKTRRDKRDAKKSGANKLEDMEENEKKVLEKLKHNFESTISLLEFDIKVATKKVVVEQWLVSQYIDTVSMRKQFPYAQQQNDNNIKPAHGLATKLMLTSVAAKVGQYELSAALQQTSFVPVNTKVEGRIFTFLPMPIETGLPVHVNGYFELNSSRTDVFTSKDTNAAVLKWNEGLRDKGIVNCYMTIMETLLQMKYSTEEYYKLFPNSFNTSSSFWQEMIQTFYSRMGNRSCLPYEENGVILNIYSPGETHFVVQQDTPTGFELDDENSLQHRRRNFKKTQQGYDFSLQEKPKMKFFDEVLALLKQLKFPLVLAPEYVFEEFGMIKARAVQVSPLSVRLHYSKLNIDCVPIADTIFQTKDNVLKLLKYALTDIHDAKSLHGLPFLVLANGQLTSFGLSTRYHGDEDERFLLSLSLDLFIDPDCMSVCKQNQSLSFFDQVSIRKFTVKILLENIHRVLPSDWHHQAIVDWTPGAEFEVSNSNNANETISPVKKTRGKKKKDDKEDETYNIISNFIQKHTPTGSNKVPSLEWIDKLWNYVGSNAIPQMAELDYPLLPSSDNKYLISIKTGAQYMFFLPYHPNKLESFTIQIMKKLSAAFLSQAYCLKYQNLRSYLVYPNGEGMLGWFSRNPAKVTNLNGKERQWILKLISTTVTKEEIRKYAHSLKMHPLFEVEDGETPDLLVNLCARAIWDSSDMNKLDPELATQIEEYCQSCFTAVDHGAWRILPRNVPVSKINRQFLKFKPDLKPLYQAMDITVLNRSLYFKLYVVPEFHKLKPVEQIRTMTFIRDEYKSLLAEYSDLQTVVANHSFVTTRGGKLMPPHQLYHPQNIVFQILFEDQPVRFPSAEYSTIQWLDFLGRTGMNIHTGISQILAAAEKLEQKGDYYNTYDQAIKLFNYIMDIAPTLNTRLARDLFGELKKIKFAPAIWDSRVNKDTKAVLESFSLVVQPKDAYLTWMIRPKLHADAKFNSQWAGKLGVPPEPQLQVVLEHLLAITAADQDHSVDIEAVLTYLASECSSLGQRQQQIQNQMKLLQKQLSSMSSKKQKKSARKKNRKNVDIDEDEENNNNNSLEEEQNLEGEITVDEMDSYVAEFSQKLNETFHSLKCFKIDSTLWVSKEQMFFKLSADLRPFFFAVPEQLFPLYPLLKFIGVTEEPSLEQLVDVVDQLRMRAKGKPLNMNQMQLCLKVLKMITGKSSHSFIPNLWIPDLAQRLQPMTEIVYIDSSYLCKRIKMDRLSILHASISNKMAKKLGITPISQVIEESLRDGFQYIPKEHPFAKHVEATIQSKEFTEGIHRIMFHQNALSELKSMKQIFGKLSELSEFRVLCVDALQSKFTDVRTQTDVTLEYDGSLCVLDIHKKGIFFVGEFAKPQEIMASEINKFLGNSITDTLFLQAILASPPHMIHQILTLLKVSELNSHAALKSSTMEQGVGDTFSESDTAQLRKSPICAYFVNEIVVCRIDDKLLYGVITQQISSTNSDRLAVYDVMIGPGVNVQIGLPELYKLKGTETLGDKYFGKFTPPQQVEQFLKLAMKEKEQPRALALNRLKEAWGKKHNSEANGTLLRFQDL